MQRWKAGFDGFVTDSGMSHRLKFYKSIEYIFGIYLDFLFLFVREKRTFFGSDNYS